MFMAGTDFEADAEQLEFFCNIKRFITINLNSSLSLESRFLLVFAWLDSSGPNYYMEAAFVRRLSTNGIRE